MTLMFSENFVAIDTETTGLHRHRGHVPFAISYCEPSGEVTVVQTQVDPWTRSVAWDEETIEEVQGIIDKYEHLIFHNAIYDIDMLSVIGLSVPMHKVHDTVLMSHVLDSEESHALKDLSVKYLNDTPVGNYDDEEELKRAVIAARRKATAQGIPIGPKVETDYWLPNYLNPDDDRLRIYAGADAFRTAALALLFWTPIDVEGLRDQYERERSVMLPTQWMQNNGVRLRSRTLPSMVKNFQEEADAHTKRLQQLSGMRYYNPNSYDQTTEILFGTNEKSFCLDPKSFTDSGTPSTDAAALKDQLNRLYVDKHAPKQQVDFLEELVAYRKVKTYMGYTKSYEEKAIPLSSREKRIFAKFNQTGTRFTRFSCSDPNLQNVGSRDEDTRMRRAFGPARGWYWLCYDYDQLELRIGGHASKDQTMAQAFAENKDLHQITADTLSVPRKQAKNINFAWWYGGGIRKLSAMSGMSAADFYENMRSTYQGAVSFMEETANFAKRHGYVYTLGGYRIPINRQKAYVGTNAVVQGTAGDIAKRAMIDVYNYLVQSDLTESVKLILNVHDELVFEVSEEVFHDRPDIVFKIQELMQRAGAFYGIHTPVDIQYCDRSWDQAKPFESCHAA